MKCQEGWTGQVLLCGLTCTTQYRSWPRVTEQQNCLLCAFIPIVVIHKVGVVVINPSFIHKSSETITMALSCTETLFPGKRKEVCYTAVWKQNVIVGTVSVDAQQCVMVKKTKCQLTANPITGSTENINRLSISEIHCFLHSNCHNILFPLSYRAHFQMPLKRF